MERFSNLLQLCRFGAVCALFGFTAVMPATASIEHQVSFSVEGMVVVWGETHDVEEISVAANFNTSEALVRNASYDAPVALTGHLLLPVSSTSELGLVGAPDTASSEHSFHVASNTAFNIRSDVSAVSEYMLDDVAVKITVGKDGQLGRAAQLPHVEGGSGGINSNIRTLRDMRADPMIYTGTRRTAAVSGSIVDQSVRFAVSYDAATEDFSSRDVTYTIYIP